MNAKLKLITQNNIIDFLVGNNITPGGAKHKNDAALYSASMKFLFKNI